MWLVIWFIAIVALLGAFYAALGKKMPIAIALAVIGVVATLVLMAVQD